MPGYSENFDHYQHLEQAMAEAQARHQAAVDLQARAEIGSLEHAQLTSTIRQCEAEVGVAKSAIDTFEVELGQTSPEQLQALRMGIAPEAVSFAERLDGTVNDALSDLGKAELGSLASVAGEMRRFAEGTNFLPGDNQLSDVVKTAFQHGPEFVNATIDDLTRQQTQALDLKIAQGPQPTLEMQKQNAVHAEVEATDREAWKQHELTKLEAEHARQTERLESQLAKFAQSQADKPSEIQAKQAELANQARIELAQQQAAELARAQAELARAQEHQRAAEARSQQLDNFRDVR